MEKRWGDGGGGGPPVEKVEESGEKPANAGRVLRPDAFAARLHRVSLDELRARGFEGLIVDLDNTLVGYGQEALASADLAWIASAKAAGFRLCLVSNNFSERVAKIAAELDVPAIPSALKPLPYGFSEALRVLGTARARTVVIGDQLFTDVLGAKLCGLHAILTEPLDRKEWPGTRLLRLLERILCGRRAA
ncbi:MAG: YqeG family HAD IIIA-type phosphatase [Vulcanimicrobiaceae bacterium]